MAETSDVNAPAVKTDAPPPPLKKSVRVEYLLGVMTALGPLTIDMYLPALPTIAKDLGVRVSQVELTLAAYFAGFAIGQLVVGPLLDRFGRIGPLKIGVLLYLFGTIACLVSPSIELLIGARFVQALGGAVVVVVPRAIVRDMYQGADVARAMTRLILVMGVAPIVAPLLGGALLPLGWRVIFGVLAAAALAVLFLVRFLPETFVRKENRGLLPELLTLVTERDFIAYTLIGGFAMGAMFAYISASSNLLIQFYGVEAAHFGFFFGANALSFIIMSQVSRALLMRFSPAGILRSAVFFLLGGAAVIVIATQGTGGLPLLMVGLTLYLGALGAMVPNATALALEPHGPRAGLASAVMGASQSGLAALFAFVVSATHDGTAAPLGIIMALGIGIAALVLLLHVVTARRA